MRKQDQGLLGHVNQMPVQQCEHLSALVVLISIFFPTVENLAPVQSTLNGARIIELVQHRSHR